MSGTNTAAQVPSRYDVVIDGWGFCYWNALLPSMPFRVQRATYANSPTFIERQNTSAAYGDDQQAFWLTFSQNDWTGGEGQKFFRTDDTRKRRFWKGTAIDGRIEGQLTIRNDITTVTLAAAAKASCGGKSNSDNLFVATTTNLYEVDPAGAITDRGAHGLGAAPSQFGMCSDGSSVFLTTSTAGTVGVRRWSGSAFSTFSATPADSLAFLNNTLYGVRISTNADLVKWDTGGTLSTVFGWKDALGTGYGPVFSRLRAFGNDLLVLRWHGNSDAGSELWEYDGTNTTRIAQFPKTFFANDLDVLSGVVYISGCFLTKRSATYYYKPAVFFYTSGTLDLEWKATDYVAASGSIPFTSLAMLEEGLIWNDDYSGQFKYLDTSTGGIFSIGAYTVSGDTPLMAGWQYHVLLTRNQTGSYLYPSASVGSTATVISSLVDFDSSLTKLFRGIKVDFTAGTDGDGGSVDIAYQVDSLDGAFTTLQSTAVAGTEYTLTGVSGRSLSVKITLNKGTSTMGPTLKRVYARAAPVQQTYKRRQYVLDLTGRTDRGELNDPVILRDGTLSTLTGASMATNLNTAITSATPISITDRFGTFTGVFEQGNGVTEIEEVRPGEFIAQVTVREV